MRIKALTTISASLILGLVLAACSTESTAVQVPTTIAGHCPSPEQLTPNTRSLGPEIPTTVLLTVPGDSTVDSNITTVIKASLNKAHFYVGQLAADSHGVVHTLLKPDGIYNNNPSDRQKDLSCKQRLIANTITATGKGKTPDKVNVFTALLNLQGILVGTRSTSINVVLDGSLLNTVGIDLTRVNSTTATKAINEVAAKGLLPNCKNWRVSVISSANPNLQDFYNRFFARCGGSLVNWTPNLTAFPADKRLPLSDRGQIPVARTANRIVATLPSDITFEVGRATLSGGATEALNQVLSIIPSDATPIVIDGYTDDTGTNSVNKPLSQARAGAVADWLIRNGITANRITTSGHGSSDPMAPNDTEQHRAANRRVTVTVVRKKA